MARLKGIGSFLAIAAGVFVVLRVLHAGVPLFVADARPGPFTFTRLDEIGPQMGFAPLVPAYRPAVLGQSPLEMTGWFAPEPSVRIGWRGERMLTMTEQRGGDAPARPPLARELAGHPGSRWWEELGVAHLVLERDGVWVSIETDLPIRDLTRLADTLTPAR
jgi:hypothetical protein